MQHNRHSLSDMRQTRQENSDRKNPIQRIAVLINAYHSVDNRPVSEQQKKDFKEEVKKEIRYQLKYVGDGIHGHVKASLRSKEYWEGFRDRIL